MAVQSPLVKAAKSLTRDLADLKFAAPVTHVYNPIDYAWNIHRAFLTTYGDGKKEALLLGMNPGPWGMAQTGVPFGEVSFVRDWMQLSGSVKTPAGEHKKRKIEGLACTRSEVSGARLWGAVSAKYPDPHAFFSRFFVTNYCPLMFMEETGRNRTPDKLPKEERDAVEEKCDAHLRRVVEILEPSIVIGIGAWAKKVARRALPDEVAVASILHPSPASPKANAGWVDAAHEDIRSQGLPDIL